MSISRRLYKASIVLLLSVIPWGYGYADTHQRAEPKAKIQQAESTCRGIIRDAKGEAIIGASVRIKGTTLGAYTDLDGRFTIHRVRLGSILEITSVGYVGQTHTFSGQDLTITLMEDSQQLQDVVVVGYGVQKKVNLSGSVASVDKKQLQARPIQNLSNGLQGLIPGLTITGANGAPGLDNGALRIRGVGTVNGASPYILIDGVESGTLNSLDPSDIEVSRCSKMPPQLRSMVPRPPMALSSSQLNVAVQAKLKFLIAVMSGCRMLPT